MKGLGVLTPTLVPDFGTEAFERALQTAGNPCPGADGICAQAYSSTMELAAPLIARAAEAILADLESLLGLNDTMLASTA